VHLWSSATLYNQEWWLDRSVNFKEFVARKQPDQVGVIDYHKTVLPFTPEALQALLGSTAPLTNLPVKTTSVSSLEKTSQGFKFHFHRTDDQVKLFKSTH
jgi:antitoxin component HigA of HigAB toxin-antitoxin module